jgi:hypothetical protein
MIEAIIIILALIFPDATPTRTKTGKGSTFYPIEKLNNGKFACGGGDWTDIDWPVCATRTPTSKTWGIPCGTWVHIENVRTHDTAWCKVMDRGPYGKHDANGVWFNSSLDRRQAKAENRDRRKGKYRGIIDMGRSVSKKLGSNGMVRVRVRWWKNNPLRGMLDKLHFGKDIYPKRKRRRQ